MTSILKLKEGASDVNVVKGLPWNTGTIKNYFWWKLTILLYTELVIFEKNINKIQIQV